MPRKKKSDTVEAIRLGDLCTAAALTVMREAPTEDSRAVCVVNAGTALLATETETGPTAVWYRVLFGEIAGWVPEYLLRR